MIRGVSCGDTARHAYRVARLLAGLQLQPADEEPRFMTEG